MQYGIIVQAQDLKIVGKVFGTERSGTQYTLPFANVFWESTTLGTVTDEKGDFKLDLKVSLPHKVIICYVGYLTDPIEVSDAQQNIKVQFIDEQITTDTVKTPKATTQLRHKP